MAVVGDTSIQKETTNYLSHMRDLVKRSIIYAFGSLASPLISLVLAPFLTRHLTRTEYGALALLTVTYAYFRCNTIRTGGLFFSRLQLRLRVAT